MSGNAPAPASAMAGPAAPAISAAIPMTATRPPTSRSWSWRRVVISAGMAAYGTWKNANAVAESRNPAPVNQAPAVPAATPENISANVRAAASPPSSTYGRRAPQRVRVRSLARPTSGLSTASHTLGSSTTVPARAAPIPRVSVR